MSLYLIGDVQGCNQALGRLLDTLAYSPSRDTIYLLGDLVNRGTDSAGVLRRLMGYGSSAKSLLGNHDLHLLAVANGIRPAHRSDTVVDVLQAPDRDVLLHWLAHQPLAMLENFEDQDTLMVHAGVLPGWSAIKTIALASEVQAQLQSPGLQEFLQHMYGNQPHAWVDDLIGAERYRVVVSALTRLRFCNAQGEMEFATKEGADSAPSGYMPWFEVPGRQTGGVTVAFGHWSTLGWLGRADVLALDSGCVWGGCLSAVQVRPGWGRDVPKQLSVTCEAAQQAGAA
jgi:bis(5'-nucleosyl)-tetraphosphatase (symmetrical)